MKIVTEAFLDLFLFCSQSVSCLSKFCFQYCSVFIIANCSYFSFTIYIRKYFAFCAICDNFVSFFVRLSAGPISMCEVAHCSVILSVCNIFIPSFRVLSVIDVYDDIVWNATFESVITNIFWKLCVSGFCKFWRDTNWLWLQHRDLSYFGPHGRSVQRKTNIDSCSWVAILFL